MARFLGRMFTTCAGVLLCMATAATAALPRGPVVLTEQPNRVTLRTQFSTPSFKAATNGQISLNVNDLPTTIQAGLPAVPVQTIKVALPLGARVKGVTTSAGSSQTHTGTLRVNRSMLPYSWHDLEHKAGGTAVAPKMSGDQYPARAVEWSVQYLHQMPVLVVNVYPVVSAADGRTYTFTPSTEVNVDYEAGQTKDARTPFAHELEQVRALVDNPQTVTALAKSTKTNADGYDYLIITSANFIAYNGEGNLKELQANLQTRQLRSKIVDVASIASGAGKDLQDKIRNFIKNEWKNSGIKYVLLAADGDEHGSGGVIPTRRFRCKINSYDGSWHEIENDIPCDLYYSCLDGDFDGNGNGIWGEPKDGPNGGDVDLLAEVSVGRMPMKTTAELANFVKKTIAYSTAAQPKKVLLMGEALFPEKDLYGDEYMNQLVGTCTDHTYQTKGYGTDWTAEKLYDRINEWSGMDAIAKINAGGFSMINHLGHSNTTYNMRCYSSRIKKLTNPAPFFFYTQGCFPGDFTVNDCFIEQLVRHDKGAVASIANTCYGLGPEDPAPTTTTTPGASQMLHRRFIDFVFAHPDQSMGRANAASKEAFLNLASSPEMRWVFWDANYFGDPSLRVK